MTAHRVLFTGSRTYTDRDMVKAVIAGLGLNVMDDSFGDRHRPLQVAHGAARGLDALVDDVVVNDFTSPVVTQRRCPADWAHCDPDHPEVPCPDDGGRHRQRYAKTSGTYCPIAGLRRNATMLVAFKPDLVVAFVDKQLHLSKGTNDMVERARRAVIPYHVIQTMPGRTS